MISTAVWSSRVQAALGREPRSVQEALEGLRQVLRRDRVSKEEFFRAAREGWRFERFPKGDRVALIVWAALKEALEKTRRRLVQETASTMVVRKDDRLKEEVKGVKPVGHWKSPEGRVYDVYPWDVPTRVRKGARIRHPQHGQGTVLEVNGNAVTVGFKAGRKKLALKDAKRMLLDRYAAQPDRRVADAKGALERFLSSGEEVRSMSRLEREEELAGNPHFSEGIVSQETLRLLEGAGLVLEEADDLEGLHDLVEALPAREEKVRGALEELGHPLPERWSVTEVASALKGLPTPPRKKARLWELLKEVSALRALKAELHRAGYAPVRAVAYRDSSGEAVYTAPVYG